MDTVETCYSVAASFDTYLQLFIHNSATLSQLQGDIWSNENSFVQQAGRDEMKVAVAYAKTPSSHLPRITVKAEKSSIRTAGDSVRIEPSISN
jgi:hypothetical protein